MSSDGSFQVSIPLEGKEVIVVFQESPASDNAIEIGGKFYTYTCVEQQENIRIIVEASLKSAPGDIKGFQKKVVECAQSSPGLSPLFRKTLSLESPPERILVQFIDAVNSGDFHVCMEMEHDEKIARGDVRLYYMTGGFEIVQVLETSASHAKCLIKDKQSDQFWHLEATITPVGQTQLLYMPIPTPDGLAVERMSEADLFKALKAKLKELTALGLFSGAVLIANRQGTPVFAFVGSHLPGCQFDLNTKFNLGSMNKMFTAIGILQLVQEGKIALTDSIGSILKRHPDKELAAFELHPDIASASIQELLTHTGGAGAVFGEEFNQHADELNTPKDYIKLYRERGQQTEKGKYGYSNLGFTLLGAAIEAGSGQDYYAYMREKIYAPAEMHASDSYPRNNLPENTASGFTRNYEVNECPLIKNDQALPMRAIRGAPFGGGYSTVKDLVGFATALISHKLLDNTDLLTSHAVLDDGGGLYGYGFQLSRQPPRWFGHKGKAEGINSSLRIYPDSGYVVAVMANLDLPAADRVIDFIDSRLPA